jgi:hypothetical protein
MKLPKFPQLLPRSRKLGSIHPLPHTLSWHGASLVKHRTTLPFCLMTRERLIDFAQVSVGDRHDLFVRLACFMLFIKARQKLAITKWKSRGEANPSELLCSFLLCIVPVAFMTHTMQYLECVFFIFTRRYYFVLKSNVMVACSCHVATTGKQQAPTRQNISPNFSCRCLSVEVRVGEVLCEITR